MVVLFKCSSLCTVFTATVLCETEYIQEEKILILSSQSSSTIKNFFSNFQESKVFFDKIIILNEASIDVNDIEKEVNKVIKQYQVDIFHMFLFDTYSLFFQKLLPSETKIIFTEEGNMTYQLKKNYDQEKNNVHFCNHLTDKINMNWGRIDEILLYEPEIFDGSIKVPIKKIKIESLISNSVDRKKFLKKINDFFGYIPEKEDYEVIYFDNYLCELGYIQPDFERRFLKYLLEIIQNYKYIIKLHPHEKENFYKFRYSNKLVRIQKNLGIPWEIVFLNKMDRNPLQRLVIISTGSTAGYNSIILGRKNFPNVIHISLLKIWEKYLTETYIALDQINNTNIFYSSLEKGKGYVPKTFEELQQIFNDIFKKNNQISYNEKKEIDWLRNRCIKKGKFLDNTIEESKLQIKTYKCIYEKTVIYDYTDDIIDIRFDFIQSIDLQNCEFKWIISENNLFNDIIIEKIYTVNNSEICNLEYDITGIEVNKNSNHIFFKNTKDIISGKFYSNKVINNICVLFKIINISSTRCCLKNSGIEKRNQLYYDLLYKWLCLKQKNIEFYKFLEYKKIGIYGFGKIGRLLYEEIKVLNVEVYFIEKQGSYITEEGIKVFDLKDLKEKKEVFDIIIITPIYEALKIETEIRDIYNGKLIALDKLLEYINKSSSLKNSI